MRQTDAVQGWSVRPRQEKTFQQKLLPAWALSQKAFAVQILQDIPVRAGDAGGICSPLKYYISETILRVRPWRQRWSCNWTVTCESWGKLLMEVSIYIYSFKFHLFSQTRASDLFYLLSLAGHSKMSEKLKNERFGQIPKKYSTPNVRKTAWHYNDERWQVTCNK